MAYNYTPTYVNPYVQQPWQYQQPAGQLEQLRAAQAFQAPPQPAQQPGGGLIWVQGEEGAKAYMVAPGASVMLMDSENQAFYIKTADASGMPLPLRVFDYTERTNTQQGAGTTVGVPQKEGSSVYVTRTEMQEVQAALAKQIDELRSVALLRSKAQTMKEAHNNGEPAL